MCHSDSRHKLSNTGRRRNPVWITVESTRVQAATIPETRLGRWGSVGMTVHLAFLAIHKLVSGTLTNMLPHKWFARPAPEVARDLIGCQLVRQADGMKAKGTIVETEAYQAGDPATHGHRRKTDRTAVMFGPAGYIYVYLIYGMHHCFNIVTGDNGELSAVLIRAVEFDTALPWHAQPSNGPRSKESPPVLGSSARHWKSTVRSPNCR